MNRVGFLLCNSVLKSSIVLRFALCLSDLFTAPFATHAHIGQQAGESLLVVDNLINSDLESLKRVRELTGCAEEDLQFRNVDLCNATVSLFTCHTTARYNTAQFTAHL
jgi:hypothetical protein